MMKWEYYEKRRSTSLVKFIEGRNIESYEHLTRELERQGVEPPDLGMFKDAYAIVFPPAPKVKPKPPVKKSVSKKPVVKKPVAKDPEKKAPAKRTRRTRTTRKK